MFHFVFTHIQWFNFLFCFRNVEMDSRVCKYTVTSLCVCLQVEQNTPIYTPSSLRRSEGKKKSAPQHGGLK